MRFIQRLNQIVLGCHKDRLTKMNRLMFFTHCLTHFHLNANSVKKSAVCVNEKQNEERSYIAAVQVYENKYFISYCE